jgi:hypothetical protein
MSEDTERTASPAAPPGSVPAPRTARQRRPTGAPPPLPHPVRVSTTAWLVLAVVIVTCAFLFSAETPWLRVDERADTWFLRLLAQVRTPWLTDVAGGIKAAGSGWGVTVIGLSVVALTMIFRRWRHLLVFLGGLFFLEIVGQWIYFGLSRPRPYGISIRRGRTAHVDVGGRRGEAIRLAVRDGYRFDFAPGASQVLATAVDSGVGVMSRAVLVRYVRDHEDQALCGRGAACPG